MGGVYVAESSTKAHMYCRCRADGACPILLVRATLGSVKLILDANTDPKEIDAGASRKDYDAVCGDRRHLTHHFSGYREFVVFSTHQAVAELLLWCVPEHGVDPVNL